ncbi:MAG: hypothetical protein RL839_04765 [Gammaproteobacteria bacterium]
MSANLTFKEKRYAQQIINNSKKEPSSWPDWASYVLFAIGGFLTVSVGFIFLEYPSTFAFKWVLLPGGVMGIAIMLFGAYAQRKHEESEEQRLLAGLVRKLMD